MGGQESKCGNCGTVREIIAEGDYVGLCESCARHKHGEAEEKLAKIKQSNALEQKRRSDELEKKRKDAELSYLAEKRRLERENKQKNDEQEMRAALNRLEIQNKERIAKFDAEMKNNELYWKQACMKYDQLSKDLEHRRKEASAEIEKKEKEQQLEYKKQGEELKLRHDEARETQTRKQDYEAHQVELELKQNQQDFDQAIEKKKTDAQIEIDKEMGARMTMGLKAVAPTGATVQIRMANDANPALAELLVQGYHSGLASLAIQQQPANPQQTTNPDHEHQTITDQEADKKNK